MGHVAGQCRMGIFISSAGAIMLSFRLLMIQSDPTMTIVTINTPNASASTLLVLYFVQMISIFALGAGLTNVFGRMVGSQKQGWALLTAMGVLFLVGVVVSLLLFPVSRELKC
jgi:hypothetical protein